MLDGERGAVWGCQLCVILMFRLHVESNVSSETKNTDKGRKSVQGGSEKRAVNKYQGKKSEMRVGNSKVQCYRTLRQKLFQEEGFHCD